MRFSRNGAVKLPLAFGACWRKLFLAFGACLRKHPLAFAFVVGCLCVEACSGAEGLWRRQLVVADQTECVRQAMFRARRGIRGHVGRVVGHFEGVGWSTSGVPPTCEAPRGYTLTGDVTVAGPRGNFRIRSWRRRL